MTSPALVTDVPVIQVLNKEHYFTQALVPLPSALPYPPLASSSLRVRTKVLALTVNNFTYARLGFLAGWWDVHPLPASTPAPYADAKKYGRISAWGWAEVLNSTHVSVPAGSLLWGYQPIGTLAQDLEVRDDDATGQVIVTSEYRQGIMPIYNRYIVATGAVAEVLRRDIDDRTEGVAYDALVRVMFETAYLMNRYTLGALAVAPSPIPDAAPWTPEKADIKNATIIALAPGSKVGLCFAHELRYSRGEKEKVRQIVGVASEFSMSFVDGTGLYDAVVSTNESPIDVLTKLGVEKEEKVVLVDFGGRGNAAATWATALQTVYRRFLMLAVGGEIAEVSPADALSQFQAAGPIATMIGASEMRDKAMKLDGEAKYFENLQHAWESLQIDGFKGFKVRWGTGMEAVKTGWDELAKGAVKPNEGLAFVL
ncbi:hypothetical protein GQ53DRAFT_735983 [Thozetella sp. PMI_491]|nr:hypothetical protein GQ53DRAFT_735983 [Thozetella sp. PMI_491]